MPESIVIRLTAHLRHRLLRELTLIKLVRVYRGHPRLLLLESCHTRAQAYLRLAHLGRGLRALDLHEVREHQLLNVNPHRVQLVHCLPLLRRHSLRLAVIVFIWLTLDEELRIVSFLQVHLLRDYWRRSGAIVSHLHHMLQVLVLQEDWRLVLTRGAALELLFHEGAVLGDHALLVL